MVASIPGIRYKSWRAWVRAGRPTSGPVVNREGKLLLCPTCRREGFRGWILDFSHVRGILTPNQIWGFLSTSYPRAWELCPPCSVAHVKRWGPPGVIR